MVDLPREAEIRGMSPKALQVLLETDYQLVLPTKCSERFLLEVVKREKLAIHSFHARHFHLTVANSTKRKALEELARSKEALQPYLPNEKIEDRDWLVQVIATVDVDLVLTLQLEALRSKGRCLKAKLAG